MPKRTDLQTILVIGSGPIVIGQACEFDYSGTQAVKALRREGYRVVLINSNPATIMTDPGLADRVYVEPLTPEFVERVIEKEKPDALLPTMGGQTALNLAMELSKNGSLERLGVELIGASADAIDKAEDRQRFKDTMSAIGLAVPESVAVTSVEEAVAAAGRLSFPWILRPSFTLGGGGGGIAHDRAELEAKTAAALAASPVHQVLLEESVLGWKEFELEVMRDRKDNAVVVCSIENLDPMGVHTGDSITIAPAQTLTDAQYQRMRDAGLAAMRAIGVETGGSNVQFAVDPATGRMVVIEMNPRVSRSSALASKATGFPIAKIAALLAVGYTLDEIPNDITKKTPACFEPSIDYVVVKAPRFAFEKFAGAERRLGPTMKSVGEAMAIGRNFKQALQKAMRSLEIGRPGLVSGQSPLDDAELERRLKVPAPDLIFLVKRALDRGWAVEKLHRLTSIDPWFLRQMRELAEFERELSRSGLGADRLRRAKELGFSDAQLAALTGKSEKAVRALRLAKGLRPSFGQVDTCAAEFQAETPYFYSTYGAVAEKPAPRRRGGKRVAILGAGPNRIGQGIEFDYCCVRACKAFHELGFETVMLNCNPETVSTDYDTSDRLYFEPLTFEDVMEVLEREQPRGVVVQLGGQTPLNLARRLADAGVRILGTSADSIDLAEDRKLFDRFARGLGIPMPRSGTADTVAKAAKIAGKIGYPVMLRPSYVLGGRAMECAYDEAHLRSYMERAAKVAPDKPVLIDQFLQQATEVDVDALCDGKTVFVCGLMEHIEEAGIHSGDSACSLPPHSLSPVVQETILDHTRRLALALGVRGLMNCQFAVHRGDVYLLEANPRASRTVPFVSKATGVPMADLAARIMAGGRLEALLPAGLLRRPFPMPAYTAVKEAVVPFLRFPGVDPKLGPEMKSTGEVMGLDLDFGRAFAKSQAAASMKLPTTGTVFVSVKDVDKPLLTPVARQLAEWGFKIVATKNTAEYLERWGVAVERVHKIGEGRPDVVELIRDGKVQLVINTPTGQQKAYSDGYAIRRTALEKNVPSASTPFAAKAAIKGIQALREGRGFEVRALQDWYAELPYPLSGPRLKPARRPPARPRVAV